MAGPVLLGIPILITAIITVVSAVLSWFAKYFTRRLLMMAIYIAAATALSVAFYQLLDSTATGLITAIPPDITTFAKMVLPSNTALCVSSIVASDIAHYVYRWNVHFLSKKFD